MTKEEFIARITPLAVQDMQRTGIPASLTISQAALRLEPLNIITGKL
ncbi:hypothetical protein [Paenibacillus sp. sgz500958]